MKYFYIISIILVTLLFCNTCGIEDTTMFFQEPKNLAYDEATCTIQFDGYNQEKDGDEYLFVGYDVYYYFDNNSKNAKKAAVRIPQESSARGANHSNLIDFADPNIDSSFQNFPVEDLNEIYQDITFPVTEEMIDDILKEGKSDNVKLCFDNTAKIQDSDDNPNIIGDYIYMEELFPKYDQYKSNIDDWGGIDGNTNNFKGFLDLDYYNYYSYTPYQTIGTDNYYKMKIFVIAKGFNSNTERNKGDYIESLKSTAKEISIKVDINTETP